MTDDRQKSRRWYQFRLRTLLICVLVLSVPLSWFGVRLEKARKQRNAIDLLEDKGCIFVYQYPRVKEIRVPIQVLAAYSRVTDSDLKHLRDLTEITHIYLNETAITDAGLQHLEGLTQLRELSLEHTDITDDGLKHLPGLTSLRVLRLGYTPITDVGLNQLEELTNLRCLDVGGKVTPSGVAEFNRAVPDCAVYAITPENCVRVDTQE
jgi:Leucine Rich repeat